VQQSQLPPPLPISLHITPVTKPGGAEIKVDFGYPKKWKANLNLEQRT